MKKQTLNTIAKNLFLGNILLAALFLTQQVKANTRIALGNENETIVDSVKTSKLDVTYAGTNRSALEFDVRYANPKGSYFTFIIKDESGEVLYEKEYNSKQFYKKVQLPQIDDTKFLTFTISAPKEKFMQTKEIKISSTLIEDVLVRID